MESHVCSFTTTLLTFPIVNYWRARPDVFFLVIVIDLSIEHVSLHDYRPYEYALRNYASGVVVKFSHSVCYMYARAING